MMEESAKILGGIKFSVWSPTEVRKFSVAEVTAPETYDEDGMPVQGGLMDNRLGTLEPGQKSRDVRQHVCEMPRALWPHRAGRAGAAHRICR
ncbi:hypothetical protein [Candidatus Nitrososphaera sp. FF02]|uniref:hypothetical protein n=1 Tax=Candidatus Nitrososphaera sp. FF02 TaxID=3398226 RepID=UPI0039E7A448